MAATQPGDRDQRSSGLLNLSSNNPFRNRAVSPSTSQSPVSPFDDPPPRPLSRNPFLDPAITNRSSFSNIRSASETMSFDKRPSLTAEEIFGSLTLEDSTSTSPPKPSADRRAPPPPGRRGPPPSHRPTRSQEEALRARKVERNGDRPILIDLSDSPPPRPERRPRRNSESSIMDMDRFMTEEERKQREMRRRERERRHRDREREKRPVNRKLDIIDQLDATSIYGTGMFHHDGPFDALNPHRNRKGSRRAPMQAFPEGSLNNTIGGVGPLKSRPDHSALMGHQDEEAFMEWSGAGKEKGEVEVPVFDPLRRGNVLHGDASLGLGTSTFLEGTPAAQTVIRRREEEQAEMMRDGSLQRKKSLAHRIRNINRGPREYQPSGRMTNPETGYGSRRSPSESGPASASLASATSDRSNPFFSEYAPGKSNGEEGFTVRKADSPTSPRGGGLERRSTADSADDVQPKSGGGLLGRMKSLKGGRRPRPSQPGAEVDAVPPAAVPAPGTAV